MLVKPGEEKPIQWFVRTLVEGNGLRWAQQQESAPYQVLIAPESLEGWPAWDDQPQAPPPAEP